jgi:hypothetical protein
LFISDPYIPADHLPNLCDGRNHLLVISVAFLLLSARSILWFNIPMPSVILIRGGGDLATGVALRLIRSGLRVVVTEIPQPLAVRRTVSFAEAVYAEQIT